MNKKSQGTGYGRRLFLKAAGVSIALPCLESLAGPTRKDVGEPMRMVCISSALGLYPGAFFPKSFGADYQLSPTLQPLSKMRDQFTVFSHMDHPGIFSKHGAMKSVLSGVSPAGALAGTAVSVDQVAAEHVGYRTRFPSLHVCVGGTLGASWTKSGIKVREHGNPRDLFKLLFVRDSAAAIKAREKELDEQGSILDLLRAQTKQFERRTSPSDKKKLDEYLTAIREAEIKLQGMQRWLNTSKPNVDYDATGHPHSDMDYEFLAPLMFDLLFLAIQSDSSRVFTAGFGMHNRTIELDGVTGGYHGLSHHGNVPKSLQQLQIIDKFYFEQMARFTSRLQDTPLANRGDGTLLDKTMVLFGTGLGDAARHSNRDLPTVIAGGGLKHRGHVEAKLPRGQRTPLNNLYTTMLQKFGVEIDRFNNASGTVDFG
ncbi:MAG: DUF1552 domain-containing protein [Planctomycetota bacterium]|nr:DUF1552 domain-containing protein [Planctomycetota bacterium]